MHVCRLLRTDHHLFIWHHFTEVGDVPNSQTATPGRFPKFVTRGAVEISYNDAEIPEDLRDWIPPSPFVIRAPMMSQGFGRMAYSSRIVEAPCEMLYVFPLERDYLLSMWSENIVERILGADTWLGAGVYEVGLFTRPPLADSGAEALERALGIDLIKPVPDGGLPRGQLDGR